MKYQGKVVLLNKPEIENKSNLELDQKTKAALEEDLVKHYTRLKVHAVGEDVTFCKVGDEVLITPRQLSHCDTIELDGKIKFVAVESNCLAVY